MNHLHSSHLPSESLPRLPERACLLYGSSIKEIACHFWSPSSAGFVPPCWALFALAWGTHSSFDLALVSNHCCCCCLCQYTHITFSQQLGEEGTEDEFPVDTAGWPEGCAKRLFGRGGSCLTERTKVSLFGDVFQCAPEKIVSTKSQKTTNFILQMDDNFSPQTITHPAQLLFGSQFRQSFR